MTRREKSILRDFLCRIASAVSTHGDDDEEAIEMNVAEAKAFNFLALSCGGVKKIEYQRPKKEGQ